MRKFKNILIWGSIALYLIFVLGFVASKYHKRQCNSVVVLIKDSAKNHFMDRNDILNLIYKAKSRIIGYPIDSINTSIIELKLKKQAAVKKVEVYKTMDGTLKIEIEQRTPLLRVINNNNESYYIDDQGSVLPLSDKYTAHVVVATGNIKDSFKDKKTYKLPVSGDTALVQNCMPCNLYILCNYIKTDEFLDALIEQIYVNNKGEFELVPKVGNYIIELGELEDYKLKFRNLKAFYAGGFKKTGWNKYKRVSIKYRNQVVCEKRDT